MGTDAPYGAYNDQTGTYIDRASGDYDAGSIPGLTCLGTQGGQEGEGWLSAAWSGGGEMRGKVESAMKGVDLDAIDARRKQWESVMNAMSDHAQSMRQIRSNLSSVWDGDDADAAFKVFDGHSATMYQRANDAASITGALRNTHDQLKWCKDKWGHDSSTMGGFGNWVSGDEDRESANDYNTTVKNVVTAMNEMPQSTPSQIKGGATNPNFSTPDSPTGGAPSGAPSMGAGGAAPHGNVPMPGINDPGTLPPPVDTPVDPPPPPVDPPPIDPPVEPPVDPPWQNPPNVDNPNLGNVDAPNTDGLYGTNVPNLDSGTSLSGYDGAGGLAGGGAPGLGGYGAGVGAGGLSGAGGGLGSGLGAGAGAAGLGGTAGLGGAGAGVGGAGVLVGSGAGMGAGGTRGGMGAMPMRGGGAGGGDDDERERNTWLEEDEDVWGGSDAPPGVISD